MIHNQTNKTAVRSQQMITETLLGMMEHKPFHQICITELCEAAAVGRKTFYRNFDFKEDVIDFKLNELCELFEQEILGKPIETQLYLYFAFARRHVDFFSAMYRNGLFPLCQKRFSCFLPATMPIWSQDPLEQEYLSRSMTAGIEAILQVWAEHSFREDIDTVVALAHRIHC